MEREDGEGRRREYEKNSRGKRGRGRREGRRRKKGRGGRREEKGGRWRRGRSCSSYLGHLHLVGGSVEDWSVVVDVLVKWWNGEMVKRWNGEIVKWLNGEMVEWWNGEMVEL